MNPLFTKSLTLLSILFLLTFTACTETSDHKQKKHTHSPMGIGDEDNPMARLEYEFDRLKSPITGEIPYNVRQKELSFAKEMKQKTPAQHAKTSSNDWQQRGPFNAGGRTRAIALDITDETVILAGGVTSGLHKSIDGGQSFQLKTKPGDLHSVTAIAQDTREGHTDTWYYGTGEYYGVISAASFSNQTSGNGLYKSVDGGENWTLMENTTSNTPQDRTDGTFDIVWRLITDPTDMEKEVVLAAVYNGIMYSDDGGENWENVLGFESNNVTSDFTDIVVSPTGVFWAALGGTAVSSLSGIYRSENGTDWEEMTPTGLDWPSNIRRPVLALNPCNENEVYVLAEAPGFGVVGHALLFGTFGETEMSWENRSTNLPNGSCEFFYTFDFGPFDSQNSYDITVAVAPDCETLFIGGTNLYRSADGFATGEYDWIGGYQCDSIRPANYVWTNHHPDQHYMIFSPTNPNVMYSANDGGLYKTENALGAAPIWEDINNGYVAGQYYTIAIEPGETDSDWIIGGTQDNGTWLTHSGDPDVDWKYTYIGDGSYCHVTEGREIAYLSWQQGRIFKFLFNEDGSINDFTRIDHAEPLDLTVFITPFIVDPMDKHTMYVPQNLEIWRNTQLDEVELTQNEYEPVPENWDKLSLGSPIALDRVTCLAMSESNPNRLFYGTDDGDVFYVENANGKEDGNTVKTKLSDSTIPGNTYVSSIALSEDNPDEIMITLSNYNVESVFYTNDFGENWTPIGGNLEDKDTLTATTGPSVVWGAIHNGADGEEYYVGTSIGLYSTLTPNDSLTQWQQEGESTIGNSIINMIQTRSHDDRIVVATHGNGVYSNGTTWQPPAIGVPTVSEKATVIFGLKASPNPFVDQTNISWKQSTSADVKVTVFDLTGKETAVLFDGFKQAGSHQLEWRSADLMSGTYVIVLENKEGRESIQVVK